MNIEEFIQESQAILNRFKETVQEKPKLLTYDEVNALSEQDKELLFKKYGERVYWTLPNVINNAISKLRHYNYTISVSKAIKPYYQLHRLDKNRSQYLKVSGANCTQLAPSANDVADIYNNLAYMAFQDREARLNA